MKCKVLFLALSLQAVIVLEAVPTLIATSLVSGCGAHKARTGFVKTVKVPRQKALLVPPGPESKPVKIDEMGHKYYDLNGNGIIDCYVETDDFRMFNYLEDVLGNQFSFGWVGERKAKGWKFFGELEDVVIKNAPDNLWVGHIYMNGSEMTDLSKALKHGSDAAKTVITEDMENKTLTEYAKRYPPLKQLGQEWIAEYEGNQRLYYPLKGVEEAQRALPISMGEWKKIKANSPVLIEYW